MWTMDQKVINHIIVMNYLIDKSTYCQEPLFFKVFNTYI